MNKRTLNLDLYSGKYRQRVEKSKRQREEALEKKYEKRNLNHRLEDGDFFFEFKKKSFQ